MWKKQEQMDQLKSATSAVRSADFARIEEPLFEQARLNGTKTAIIDGEREYDYRTLANLVEATATTLTQHGLQPGDRVSIYLDKTAEAVVALYGVWTAGGVAVPVNESLKTRQVDHILTNSGSKLVLTNSRMTSKVDETIFLNRAVLQITLNQEKGTAQSRLRLISSPTNEPAAILYTSGSTGRPKGILISHENLLAGARIVSEYLGIQEDERIISILPFSFDYGLNQLLTSVGKGATLVLQRSHFLPDICRTLQKHQITAMAAVPPLWIQLMHGYSPFPTMSFPHLRYMTNSGGVFPVELVRKYRAHLPHTRIVLMYGLSEAFRSAYLPPDQIDIRPSSMGKAIPETELFVLDEEGYECAPGQVGELVHRGPTVALGYWDDPEATQAVFRPDPFASANREDRVVYSGDLVKKDEEGYLYFVSRRDQMIKTQGFRISPEEVEEFIFDSELVSEVAVCGDPDPVSGSVIVAHVVPRNKDTFSTSELLSYCQREMPSYMVPRMFRLHDSLPRTASGKMDRKTLKK